MRAAINEDGSLLLLRGGLLQVQECPHNTDAGHCGGWCPLFREPVNVPGGGVELEICRRVFTFSPGEFRDYRPTAVRVKTT